MDLLCVENQVKSLTAVEREARVARNERQVLGDGMGNDYMEHKPLLRYATISSRTDSALI